MHIIGAQINVTIGDLAANADKVEQHIKANSANIAQTMLVFPELTLTGYPPADLLFRRGFVEEQLEYAEKIKALTAGNQGLWVVLGLATKNTSGVGKPLHNSLVVYHNGAEVLRYHKQLLPTYNVFDENRYFEAGSSGQANVLQIRDERFAFLICEDAWNNTEKEQLYGVDPVANTFARNNNVTLVTINASPSHIGKNSERYAMYQKIAQRYDVNVVYVNQVGAHDSLIFDGYSFVATPDGIICDVEGYKEQELQFDTKRYSDLPIIPQAGFDKYGEMFNHLVLGIRDYVRKNGFKSVVVGSSGGIDSALVLALAKEALGPENVFAITMPSKFSSEGSVTDSHALCDNLNIKLYERPIGDEVMLSIENFTHAFGASPSRLTIENEQARIRGRILMEYSNHFGSLVLSTGNKTETSVGYCTIYGDMCGGLAVIADIYKMEAYGLAAWMNLNLYTKSGVTKGIPQPIIDKAPSAELWEGQKDTDSLPPYPILDALLKLYIERDMLTEQEVKENLALIKNLTVNDIEKYLKMTDRAEFKRQQAAIILRVHKRAFGAGRVLPVTQKHSPSYKNVL